MWKKSRKKNAMAFKAFVTRDWAAFMDNAKNAKRFIETPVTRKFSATFREPLKRKISFAALSVRQTVTDPMIFLARLRI